MNRNQLLIGGGVVVLILAGIFYWSFFRESEVASEDISESVVELDASAGNVFTIDPSRSTASFTIAEILRGEDFVVLGETDQVGGQVAFDPADPTSAEIGEIVINARTFVTDNSMRNNAINNRILFTDDFEFVRFQPTAINGLPSSVTIGEAIAAEIVGDLTIMDTTLPVTFDTTLTYISDSEITGSASSTIIYGDFGVDVPLTPSVSFVADELTMMLDFVATSQ
ncbi:MAG: YceI family protein [Chloroflexota bacterium]